VKSLTKKPFLRIIRMTEFYNYSAMKKIITLILGFLFFTANVRSQNIKLSGFKAEISSRSILQWDLYYEQYNMIDSQDYHATFRLCNNLIELIGEEMGSKTYTIYQRNPINDYQTWEDAWAIGQNGKTTYVMIGVVNNVLKISLSTPNLGRVVTYYVQSDHIHFLK